MSRIFTATAFALVAAAGFSAHAAIIANILGQHGCPGVALLKESYGLTGTRLFGKWRQDGWRR